MTAPPDRADVLVRCDGGPVPRLALGHVQRCLALARFLRDHHGRGVRFLMRDLPKGPAMVVAEGFPVTRLAADASPADTARALGAAEERWIVLDLLPEHMPPEPGFGGPRPRITALDDLGGAPAWVDVIVNGRLDATTAYPEGPVTCLGPDYCILDVGALAPPPRRGSARLVLVTLGGADPAGMTAPLVTAALGTLPPETILWVALGPAHMAPGPVRALAAEAGGRVVLHEAPGDLLALARQADLVVCAGGRTAFEMAALGLPALVVPSTVHEEPVARALSRAGCALTASPAAPLGDFRERLSALAGDFETRAALARVGPRLFDGRGVARVARVVLGE